VDLDKTYAMAVITYNEIQRKVMHHLRHSPHSLNIHVL